jgi:hypothetical protein
MAPIECTALGRKGQDVLDLPGVERDVSGGVACDNDVATYSFALNLHVVELVMGAVTSMGDLKNPNFFVQHLFQQFVLNFKVELASNGTSLALQDLMMLWGGDTV